MAQGDLDIALASGKGAMAGGQTGLMIGGNPALMAATGGLSAPIGAAAGAIIGGVGAGVKQNKANKAQEIPFVDPMESKRLAEIEQTRKNLMLGSDSLTQRRMDEAKNVGAAVQGAITRSTGGDVASTMDALLKAQKNTQSAINQGITESQSRLPYFDNASTMLNQRIAQRKLELRLLDRAQKTAENAQVRKEANLNANALLGSGINEDALKQLLELIKRQGIGGNLGAQPVSEGNLVPFDNTGATNLSGDWATGMGFNQAMPSIGG